jgi:hypothetical protein
MPVFTPAGPPVSRLSAEDEDEDVDFNALDDIDDEDLDDEDLDDDYEEE